jgi:preprotein translocase subunit SecF
MNVIKHKWIFLGFSGLLIAASIYGLFAFGLQKGIDFTGGTLWQVKFAGPVVKGALVETLHKDFGLTDAAVTEQEDTGAYIIRTKEMSELSHQDFSRRLTATYGPFTDLSFESIGAAIGSELADKALWAFAINLVAISLYIAYAFRKVSHPVSSWKYAAITLITLFHDAIIPIGLLTFLGHYLGVEADVNFIVAVLVVIGFSVHDTIVVFDRIRENLRLAPSSADFGALVNRSINETFARSVNTSLTLFIVLVALFILGAPTLKYFILAILVGTIAGTYSSIFVASPLLVIWQKASKKPRK